MPVTIIKRECPTHSGRYTMGEPCDLCLREQVREWLDAMFARMTASVEQKQKP